MLLKCKEIKPILAFWMTHKFTQSVKYVQKDFDFGFNTPL